MSMRADRNWQTNATVAATAVASNATLVTRNVREFRRVRGLKLVDWYS